MIKDYNGSLYGSFRQNSFQEVWDSADSFISDVSGSDIPLRIKNESLKTLYYLLYSRYGNDIVASSDINRFKYSVYSIIFQYGPVWEKKLEIQNILINLSEDELLRGSTQINNLAEHDGTEPSTQSTEELDYISNQTVTKYKRDKMNAYTNLWQVLRTDETTLFLDKFKKLFLTFIQPEAALGYDIGGWYND